jgi:protease II
MIRKTIYAILIAMLSTTAWAQNSVDDMIDEFSHIGSAEFTSAIKRNEKTHAVEKVVKKLEYDGPQSQKLISTFKKEAEKHNATTKHSDDEITMVFTTKSKKSNRIYMMKYEDEGVYPEVEITVIVKIN